MLGMCGSFLSTALPYGADYACGLRAQICAARAVDTHTVNRIATSLSARGARLVGVIVLALCRVHLG